MAKDPSFQPGLRAELVERADDPMLLFMDGFDDCIIGICNEFGPARLIYDSEAVLNALQTRNNMSREEATEYYSFNIVGAYVGEQTPILMDPV
jgi:hypothetical protein